MFYDLPRGELERYRSADFKPTDFDDFWDETLASSRRRSQAPVFEHAAVQLRTVESWDVTFSGFDGQQIKAWLQLPVGVTGRLPCMVEFVGYGGGRGLSHELLFWASAGYAHLIVDSRGQGSQWRSGDTPDTEPGHGSGNFPGFMTKGILVKEDYYYRRLITDAVLAVDAARRHRRIDPDRVAVCGTSQGGGVTLAVAGLASDLRFAMPDVPFLCDFRRATAATDTLPYNEIVRYLKVHRTETDQVFDTLRYFDGVHFAETASAPALFAVALMDTICPPSTVYAAYNNYGGPKSIVAWEFNDHESGGPDQRERELDFARQQFGQ